MSDELNTTDSDRMKAALKRIVFACESWLQSDWKVNPDGRIDAILRQAKRGLAEKIDP